MSRFSHRAFFYFAAALFAVAFLSPSRARAIEMAVSHYALDEAVAGPAIDSVSGLNGTNNGATINQPGQIGSAYDFNGSSNYVDIGNQAALNFDFNNAFSATAWIRRDSTSTRAIIGRTNPNSPFDGWVVAQRTFSGNEALDFSIGPVSNRILVDSNVAIPAGVLTHIAVTYDGSGSAAGVKMYFNGSPVATTISQNNPLGSALNSIPVTLGSYGGVNRFFDGLIDDAAVFNSALTPQQVSLIYQSSVAAFIAPKGDIVSSYDGSYQPDSVTPPPGQTTWQKFDNIATAGGDITPNSPFQGLAHFNDNSGGGRLAIFDTLTDTPVAHEQWVMETRLKIDTFTSSPFFVGVRDEGGSGRTLMLGFNSANGNLNFYNNSSGIVQAVSSANFIDGQFHTYRVEKTFGAPGDFLIQVYIDDVPQFGSPLSYNAVFPLEVGTGNGVGYFSSTPGTSDVSLDFLRLSTIPVPEPATAVLAFMGSLLITRRRRA